MFEYKVEIIIDSRVHNNNRCKADRGSAASLVRPRSLIVVRPSLLLHRDSPTKTAMSELFKDIPEFVEVSMPRERHQLTRRPTSERVLQPEQKPLVRLVCPVHPTVA